MARIRAAVTLIGEEEDPLERGLTKAYADQLSSTLIVNGRSPTDLKQLEAMLDRALQKPERAAPPEAPRKGPPEEEMGLMVLGALLDFPELLQDSEIEESLALLDGLVALAVAAMRQCLGHRDGFDVGEFLARCPAPIHPFAARRLAGPVFESLGDAKAEALQNAQKLQRLLLKNDNTASREELRRLDMLGDVASEEAKLREIQQRALKRHNLR
jgi:DNA primase